MMGNRELQLGYELTGVQKAYGDVGYGDARGGILHIPDLSILLTA